MYVNSFGKKLNFIKIFDEKHKYYNKPTARGCRKPLRDTVSITDCLKFFNFFGQIFVRLFRCQSLGSDWISVRNKLSS
jgi:hypothetical protein